MISGIVAAVSCERACRCGTQRQVGGDLEGGLAHPAAVDLLGGLPVLQLAQRPRCRRSRARSRSPPARRAGRGPRRCGPALAQGQQRAAASASRAAVHARRAPPRPLGRAGVDVEGGEHRDDVSRAPRRGGPASPSSRWRCRTPRPGRAGTLRVRAPAHPGRYQTRPLRPPPETEDADPGGPMTALAHLPTELTIDDPVDRAHAARRRHRRERVRQLLRDHHPGQSRDRPPGQHDEGPAPRSGRQHHRRRRLPALTGGPK